ncbi:MAG TPA: hypothetical protein ENN85_07855 [Methanoculleus sp.]|nr:hypothetical protein [Methanoculleus sp.]
MITDVERNEILRYITERRCTDGGYCHYRLDEPNAADTFYALDSLRLLDALSPDRATEDFLLGMQHPDGGYATLYAGAFALRSLALIGSGPALDPQPWLCAMHPVPHSEQRPVESLSAFERTCTHLTLCRILRIRTDGPLRDAVLRHLHAHHHADGGFGHPQSTLIETAHSLAILGILGQPPDRYGTRWFLLQCEHPMFGYLNHPRATPAFLEHVAAGVECAVLTGRPPGYPEGCRTFVRKCRNANGGYTRSIFGGISTLENTWLAIRALTRIRQTEPHGEYAHERK